MTTYHQTSSLSEPQGSERIDRGTLAYFQSRNKHRVYDLVIQQFIASGLTQAVLARRLGRGADQVNRWLGSPGNWTLDTLSDLLFAIAGGEAEYSVTYPLKLSKRNFTAPEWASSDQDLLASAPKPSVSSPSQFLQLQFGATK